MKKSVLSPPQILLLNFKWVHKSLSLQVCIELKQKALFAETALSSVERAKPFEMVPSQAVVF